MDNQINPPEPKEKCFTFEAIVESKVKGYVWAETIEEALELINQKDWTELEDEAIQEVHDVMSIKED